jgi:hypothetical protein
MSKKRFGLRPRLAGLTMIAAAAALMVFFVAGAFGNTPLPHAAFTTVNTDADGSGHCANGNPAVNCNIYDGKQYVWLNGGPVAASLADGTYFFAVLAPGGQGGNENPNDGTTNNLSDLDPSSNTGAGDSYLNRIFTVSSGAITYTGNVGNVDPADDETPHDSADNKIRLFPYDDTTNPGGVYIMAICSLADATFTGDLPGVDPSDCKYDAFKINTDNSLPPADALTVEKTANGAYTNTYAWDGGKSVDKTLVRQIGGSATFTYTLTETHDAGTIGGIGVSGAITISNPNDEAVVVNVADVLSNSTTCTVKDGTTTLTGSSDVTVPGGPGTKALTYTCAIGGSTLPTGLTNTVTVSWNSQLLDDGSFLVAGSADFTSDPIAFTATPADDCITITDTFDGTATTLGVACVNNSPAFVKDAGNTLWPNSANATDPSYNSTTRTFTFTYNRSVTVPSSGCVTKTNAANFTTNTNGLTDTNTTTVDTRTVQVCGPTNPGALTMGFWKGPNGQNLITYYGSGLWAFLDGFAPLGGVNSLTDVNNVFKAASATNMNAMLKAQMLATALDVYFSSGGYSSANIGSGKNQIKAPSNFLPHGGLGTFVMDLTAICPMVDALSTGTATCSGNHPSTDGNAAGAFPWASRSIADILTFASTVDLSTPVWDLGAYSATANVWYYNTTASVQDRTKQEILKNVFDQFNNGMAFAPTP